MTDQPNSAPRSAKGWWIVRWLTPPTAEPDPRDLDDAIKAIRAADNPGAEAREQARGMLQNYRRRKRIFWLSRLAVIANILLAVGLVMVYIIPRLTPTEPLQASEATASPLTTPASGSSTQTPGPTVASLKIGYEGGSTITVIAKDAADKPVGNINVTVSVTQADQELLNTDSQTAATSGTVQFPLQPPPSLFEMFKITATAGNVTADQEIPAQAAKLTVQPINDFITVEAGEKFTLTFSIENISDVDPTDVVFYSTIPNQFTFVSPEDQQSTCEEVSQEPSLQVKCSVATTTLTNQSPSSVTFTLKAPDTAQENVAFDYWVVQGEAQIIYAPEDNDSSGGTGQSSASLAVVIPPPAAITITPNPIILAAAGGDTTPIPIEVQIWKDIDKTKSYTYPVTITLAYSLIPTRHLTETMVSGPLTTTLASDQVLNPTQTGQLEARTPSGLIGTAGIILAETLTVDEQTHLYKNKTLEENDIILFKLLENAQVFLIEKNNDSYKVAVDIWLRAEAVNTSNNTINIENNIPIIINEPPVILETESPALYEAAHGMPVVILDSKTCSDAYGYICSDNDEILLVRIQGWGSADDLTTGQTDQ